MIIRMQDSSGRGPWRPGFSEKWVDAWRTSAPPPIYAEVLDFRGMVAKAHAQGFHVGCAVRNTKFLDWFSVPECFRLTAMGFRIVDASDCMILAETETQILIGSPRSLRHLRPVASIGGQT